MSIVTIKPEWENPGEPFRHTWEGLGNIDQFRWFVRKDCLEHLKLAHDELGLRHVRAAGMFDDELRVVGLDPKRWTTAGGVPNSSRLNWQIVDYALESLLELGIKPVFTTCFTPGAMASGPETVFTTRANVFKPKDLSEWERFVAQAARHAIERFGVKEVRKWYFEAWNEPNLRGFFAGTQSDFLSLWQRTYSGLKSVDTGLRIGGPSTARGEWIDEVLDWTRAQSCEPDYFITHCYNNDSAHGALSPFDGPQEGKSSNSPDFLSGVVRGVRARLDRLGFCGEVHFNEWGRSWHPSDDRRETENVAAFIVKTMAEVSQQADYFGYWCLSDIYDQAGYGAETFHGNYGLINLQGIRKPSWHAHALLSKLDQRRLPIECAAPEKCCGALVTASAQAAHVLVYGYQQESVKSTAATVRVQLSASRGIPRLGLWRIGPDENNAPALWRERGAPPYLRRAERLELVEASRLRKSPETVRLEMTRSGLVAEFAFTLPGVALLEIEYVG